MLNDFAEHKDDSTKDTMRPQKILWDVRQNMGPADIVQSVSHTINALSVDFATNCT